MLCIGQNALFNFHTDSAGGLCKIYCWMAPCLGAALALCRGSWGLYQIMIRVQRREPLYGVFTTFTKSCQAILKAYWLEQSKAIDWRDARVRALFGQRQRSVRMVRGLARGLNACYNAVTGTIENGRADQVAIFHVQPDHRHPRPRLLAEPANSASPSRRGCATKRMAWGKADRTGMTYRTSDHRYCQWSRSA